MDLFTTQMSKWRIANQRNITFVDTTVKTGTKLFAPTWEIVLAVKGGEIGPAEYTYEYRRLMAASASREPQKWLTFLRQPEPVAIACYCAAGEFCHRHILKDIFEGICSRQNIPFLYYGELE